MTMAEDFRLEPFFEQVVHDLGFDPAMGSVLADGQPVADGEAVS